MQLLDLQSTLTPTPPPSERALLLGHVVSVDERGMSVQIDSAVTSARQALSCLVQPAAGDLVACVLSAAGVAYVVFVLERAGAAPLHLQLGGATLSTTGGACTLKAQRLTLDAPTLAVNAEALSVTARTLTTFAEKVDAGLGWLRTTGQQWSTVFERVFHLAGDSQRVTERLDQVRAQNATVEVAQTLSLQADVVVSTGATLAKTRGAQIHFG